MSKNNQKKIIFLIKLTITICLAGYIYLKVDKNGLLKAIESISLTSALSILFLYTVGQILSAKKWLLFLKETGLQKTRLEAIRAYFFGMFINVFGLGTVGGDIVRALALAPPKGMRASTLFTVLADRIHGLTVLLSIGVFTISIFRPEPLGNLVSLFSIGGAISLLLLISIWLYGLSFLKKFFPSQHKWYEVLQRIETAFPRRKEVLIRASIISYLFHSIQLLMHVVIARELNSSLSVSYILAVVPFVNIVSSLPISFFNGLGVREAMYCYLFMPAGVTQAEAVAFGAIWICTVTIVSSFGVFVLTPDMKQAVKEAKSRKINPETNLPDNVIPLKERKRAVG